MSAVFSFFTGSRKRSLWIAIAWTLLILVACFIPGEDVPKVNLPFVDKWVHVFIFCGCSFFWYCFFARSRFIIGVRIFLGTVFLGCLVECIQGSGLVRHRSFETADILADATGAFIGLILFVLIERRQGHMRGNVRQQS